MPENAETRHEAGGLGAKFASLTLMESTAPDRRHSHRHLRQWTPSPVEENEQFDQYEFQPVPEYYTRPEIPQGHGQVLTTASLESTSSTLQPLQESGTKRGSNLGYYWSPWAWELANCGLLLISLFAIVATLYPHDGQPLPKWPFSITINALSFHLCRCHESEHVANSGVWDRSASMELVSPSTLVEGPLIIIAAVAVHPFIQQLVQPVDCKQSETEGQLPSIPRTNYLTYDSNSFPSDLLGSIAFGYYTPQNLSDYTCGTGNCTFNTKYSSLAYCSICEDVSDSIQIEEHCMVYKDGKSKPGSCYEADNPGEAPLTDLNLTTTLTSSQSIPRLWRQPSCRGP
ncbi:hypothetical protein HD806DRAFT_525764 [Xylariaceae sp. AK1471]|nr:hypothetical protein HD806DRAFT_525764 [Xylariaceae sp. AK1471]